MLLFSSLAFILWLCFFVVIIIITATRIILTGFIIIIVAGGYFCNYSDRCHWCLY